MLLRVQIRFPQYEDRENFSGSFLERLDPADMAKAISYNQAEIVWRDSGNPVYVRYRQCFLFASFHEEGCFSFFTSIRFIFDMQISVYGSYDVLVRHTLNHKETWHSAIVFIVVTM